MMRWLLCAFLLVAGAAHAQPTDATDILDQSLLDSEPVEEAPEEPAKPAPPPPLPTPPVAEETPEPTLDYDIAVLQGLKKVTAETSTFEVPLDTPTHFGTLTITLKKCSKSAPEDRPENVALLLIEDQKPDEPPITAFSGWMFSSSPAISALEHPVYDITLLECTTHKKPAPATPPPPATKTKN